MVVYGTALVTIELLGYLKVRLWSGNPCFFLALFMNRLQLLKISLWMMITGIMIVHSFTCFALIPYPRLCAENPSLESVLLHFWAESWKIWLSKLTAFGLSLQPKGQAALTGSEVTIRSDLTPRRDDETSRAKKATTEQRHPSAAKL